MKTLPLILTAALTITFMTSCTATPETPTSTVQPSDVTSKTLNNYTVTGDLTQEPQIEILRNENSIKNVMIQRIVTNKQGQTASPNDTVTFHMKTLGAKKGTTVENTWTSNTPITAEIKNLTQGLQQGITGMSEGSRRLIVVPAKKAYGNNPPEGSSITPNESLIYIVDLIDVKK